MIRSQRIEIGSLILTATLLVVGFSQIHDWVFIAISVVAGSYWMVSTRQRWLAAGFSLLAGAILLAAIGGIKGIHPFLMAVTAICAIVSWDLFEFRKRLQSAEKVIEFEVLERNHLTKLGSMAGLACVCVTVASFVRFKIDFFFAFGLGLVLILSITQFIRKIREKR